MFDGMFIAGMLLPVQGVGYKQVSYHVNADQWDRFDGVRVLECAPEWDGHTPADVVDRLNVWVPGPATGPVLRA